MEKEARRVALLIDKEQCPEIRYIRVWFEDDEIEFLDETGKSMVLASGKSRIYVAKLSEWHNEVAAEKFLKLIVGQFMEMSELVLKVYADHFKGDWEVVNLSGMLVS